MFGNGWGYLVRQQVIVNLDTGSAFKGIMFEVKGNLLLLRKAELLTNNGNTPVDGELIVEKGRVEFIQNLGLANGQRIG